VIYFLVLVWGKNEGMHFIARKKEPSPKVMSQQPKGRPDTTL
jgi:hypothetical protein